MSVRSCKYIEDGMVADPESFLSQNVLLVPAPPPNLSLSPIRTFDFDALGNRHFAGSPNGSLTAYYLPWAIDSGYHIILEKNMGAKLMFTAQLSGCGVGYIRAGDKSGAVRVAHHNIRNEEGLTDHGLMQESLSSYQSSFNRNDYRLSRTHMAYIFGVYHKKKSLFSSKKWRFYTQKIRQTGLGQYEILEVAEL